MAAVRREAVRRGVIRNAIVPESNITGVPLESSVELWRSSDDLVEQRDDVVALGLRDADDLGDKAGVEEDTFPAGNGMGADEWVFCCDWFAAHGAAEVACALRLQVCGVQRCEGLQVLLHVGAKHVVGGVLG